MTHRHMTAIRWTVRENDFMDDFEVWEGDRQVAAHLTREDAALIVALYSMLDTMFEIRDDCADVGDGMDRADLEKLAYRVVGVANGAINAVVAAAAAAPGGRR